MLRVTIISRQRSSLLKRSSAIRIHWLTSAGASSRSSTQSWMLLMN
jgi:hypothetical protein